MDLNPLKFADFAKQATRAYAEKGVALNETIAKLADENNLSPMQIQRVVEIANSETNQRLYKTAGDKTFTFELASLEGVRAKLHSSEPTVKTAQVLDVLFPSKQAKTEKLASSIEKIAAGPARAATDPLMEKRASMAFESLLAEGKKRVAKLQLEKIAAEMERDTAYNALKDRAKEYVILHHGKMADMYKFACLARPDDQELWKQLFTDMRQDLMKLGQPVDRALVDEKFGDFETPTEVINGNHAMLIELDTFKNKIGEIDRTSGKLALYNDAPDPVAIGVESIVTNEDVRRSLGEEAEKLAAEAPNLSDDELLKRAAKMPFSNAAGRAASWAVQNPWYSIPLGYLAYKGLRDVGKGVGRAVQRTRQPFYLEQPGNEGFAGFRR